LLASALLLSTVERSSMRYIVAWLLGVPFSLIAIWFLANQAGC
jgi:hypothetical protein